MPLPPIPPLTSPRTLLREVGAADLPDLLEVNADPEVTRFLRYATWQSAADAESWLARMQALAATGSARQLVICRRDDGRIIGKRGQKFITADSPGVSVWAISPGKRYVNGGSMIVDDENRLHVLVQGENGKPTHFQRDPKTTKWRRDPSQELGKLVATGKDQLFAFEDGGIYQFNATDSTRWKKLASSPPSLFGDCKPGADACDFSRDGWISIIGQQGKKISVVDFRVPLGK